MKKLLLLLIPFIFFAGCNFDPEDDIDSFAVVDYSSLVKQDSYVITPAVDAITVFNLFYDLYGYTTATISGTAEHTETAILNGITHSETVSCTITKIKVFHESGSAFGKYPTKFYVDFYNDNNEVLSYCYEWNYHNTNWKNSKTSNWLSKSTCDWNITIAR